MLDWLRDTATPTLELSLQMIAARMVVAAIAGLVVGGVYHASHRKQIADSFSFIVTLAMLTILVSMTTMVIGNSVARAFGLVGALSIVRFRTIVDDTRDTAFVIFAVVVGMAVGAGIVDVYLIGIPVVAFVSTCLSIVGQGLPPAHSDRRLEIRVEGGVDSDALVSGIFRQQLSTHRLAAVSTARQGASIDLVYSVRLARPDASLAFVRALAQLDGIQSVELK